MKIYQRLQKHILADKGLVIDLEKSKGSWIIDKETGKRYLDLSSQYASQALGWNHSGLISAKDRLMKVAFHKVANPDYYTEEYTQFVETFSSLIPDFKYSFFIDGGTLGVENSIKCAFDFKAKLLGLNDNEVNKLDIIHFKRAFHGRSGYCCSITNTHPDKTNLFPKFNWTRIDNFDLSAIEMALKTNLVAGIILEPIQGEGGDNHCFSSDYLKTLKEMADENQSLLIFDEVQTGCGLTGKMWAYEHFNVIPDLLAFGKKVQVCGFSAGSKIDLIPDNVFKVPSRISSTFGGNIVDMVRFTIIAEIMKKEKLIENAAIVGEYFLNELKKLSLIQNVRGKGLMIAFDLENTEKRNKFLEILEENMAILACGEKSIRIRPHLTLSKDDVDSAIHFIKKAIKKQTSWFSWFSRK